jgi:5-hydroxyisourate hydrolase
MGRLTTHVLDTTAGIPARDVRIQLYRIESDARTLLVERATGADGRCSAPLIEGEQFVVGRYSLHFQVSDYFRRRGVILPEPPFLEEAVIQIGIAAPDQHYHVPLLISPWSYSVYRGG